jgi:TRAP-type C4-dicarboxylate transport system permease small subunit
MRKALDALYNGAAVMAAFFMVALFGCILLSILSRELHVNIRGLDGYAGYFMAASGFLALAHTFKKHEHIRVTLLLGAARGAGRRMLELWALGASALLAALLAVFSVRLVVQSYAFNDISTSMDATPLWIPQLSMALGTVILCIAIVDELVLHARGAVDEAAPGEQLRHE